MVLNYIWMAFFLIAFVVATGKLLIGGDLDVFTHIIQATFDSAKTGFEISLGLTGILSLWLGIMKIGERGGVIQAFARLAAPVFSRLFPQIPKNHPVTGSIFMNLSANLLGLDNAATPMGLKTMQQLQELKLRLSEVQSTWEIAENHYHEIENRQEEFAKIRHDMRNQQMVLQELLHQGEYEKAEKMLETLTDTVAATTEYLYCGDPVFNAIMGETEKACREKRIAFKYDLEIPQKLKLDPVAICSILSNLTRNAVAAAEMTERQEAFLTVKAAVKGDYLHICVENSRAKKLLGRPGRKGYGLEILHDLVERNHGQIDVQPGEGSFRVDITVENF